MGSGINNAENKALSRMDKVIGHEYKKKKYDPSDDTRLPITIKEQIAYGEYVNRFNVRFKNLDSYIDKVFEYLNKHYSLLNDHVHRLDYFGVNYANLIKPYYEAESTIPYTASKLNEIKFKH